MSGRAGTLDFINDLALEIGATFDGEIALVRPDGSPSDLTGFTVLWQVREEVGDEDVLLDIGEHVTVTDPTSGIIAFAVPRSVTLELKSGTGIYDILLVQGDYGRFEARGKFQIAATVSR